MNPDISSFYEIPVKKENTLFFELKLENPHSLDSGNPDDSKIHVLMFLFMSWDWTLTDTVTINEDFK